MDGNNEIKYDQEKEKVDFDDLLTEAGAWGRYQWLLIISSCPFFVFGSYTYFGQIFITEVSSNHWCKIPELENLTETVRKDLGIPKDDHSKFGYSQCEMYAANWTDVLTSGERPNATWNIVPCQYGWEFDKSEIPYPTIGSELGWVCEKQSYQASAQAIFFVGCMVGGVFFGWIADRFGRLPAISSSCFLGCIAGFTSIFARNFVEFATTRFFLGMSYDSCMVIAYILIIEYVAPKYRALIANFTFGVFYSLSLTPLPWIALACGHWKTVCLATSLPLGFGVFAILFLPESPRWLIPKGRIDEAIEKVLNISRINKKEVPTEMIARFYLSVNKTKTETNQGYSEIVKRPLIRKLFVLMCLQFMCGVCLFDGIVRCIALLNFDFFIAFAAEALSILPSVLFTAVFMDYIGRRWLCIIAMSTCCIFFILIIFATSGLQSLIFAVIATCGTNIIYSATLQWPTEILPTPVRGSGVAIIHISGYIGTILSSYIVYLGVYDYWLPLAIYGTIAAFGMLITCALPETALTKMPDTFEEVEELSKNQKFWSLPFIEAKKVRNKQAGQINTGFAL